MIATPEVQQSSRTLLDITPIITPVQRPRELLGEGSHNVPQQTSTPQYDKSVLTMTTLKGTKRLYVEDKTHFKIGRSIIIHNLFMAQVVAFGSLFLDRPVDRNYPAGSPERDLTPQADFVVDARGRTVINGVVLDQSPKPEEQVVTDATTNVRRLPSLPEDGVLIDLQNKSKLHAWLLQGMTRRGKKHWKNCAYSYRGESQGG